MFVRVKNGANDPDPAVFVDFWSLYVVKKIK